MNIVAAATLSGRELTLLTVLFGITVFLCATFLAYTIFGKELNEIRESGVLSLLVQFSTIVLIAYGLILMMSSSVITSAAGLPALTGLVGFLLGKVPGSGKVGP
jgi:hypothetical protein